MLFKIIESIYYLFFGMNIIPIFLWKESYYIIPALFLSVLYGTLLYGKTPKINENASIFFKEKNWIFTLFFLINIVFSFIKKNSTSLLYIYLGFFFLILLFSLEIRKNNNQKNKIFFEREDILDSGEFGQK